MTPLFKKLNFKNQEVIHCLNAPNSFETELGLMEPFSKIRKEIKENEEIGFALIFVKTLAEIETSITLVEPLLLPDAPLWFVYPKGSSKKYTCEFNRDNGWAAVEKLGFETVRMVAVDEDWSALRFRKREFIKLMIRDKGGK